MFVEKLAEAQRKYEALKNGLKESNSLLHYKNERKRKQSVDIEKDDDDEEEPATTNDTSKEAGMHNSKLGLLKSTVLDGNRKLLSNVIESTSAAQSFTQRLVEKNKQRQLKNQKYRKEHDLKLAFSEFYLSLILLQNYQTLNYTGFKKILKKHDKVCLASSSFFPQILPNYNFERCLKLTAALNGCECLLSRRRSISPKK